MTPDDQVVADSQCSEAGPKPTPEQTVCNLQAKLSDTLNCEDTSEVAGWYKLFGRCGDYGGIIYWNNAVTSVGRQTAYFSLKDGMSSACPGGDWNACHDASFCNT